MTAIEWTDETWNPVTGCDRVSPGCAHCYALDLAAKFKGWGQARYQRDGGAASGPGFGVTLHRDRLEQPLRWRRPRRVFVNSMSDLFHDEIPDGFIGECFSVMRRAPAHTFQVLTKRPERMRELLSSWWGDHPSEDGHDAPPANVWLGVTVENRRFVERADLLRQTPAAVRFVSAEPLLGPLVPFYGWRSPRDRAHARPPERWWPDGYNGKGLNLAGIDWLIVGGESGAAHRRIDPEWVRDLLDDCLRQCGDCHALGGDVPAEWAPGFEDDHTHWSPCERRTAFFLKQWGGRTPKSGGRELDGRTWDEFPRPRVAVPS